MPTPKNPTNQTQSQSQFDYSKYIRDAEVTARESYRIKDGGGGKTIFLPEVVGDFQEFKPSLGIKVIDIIMSPAGKKHPLVVQGKLKEGMLTHIVWVYVHKALGPGRDWRICPARTYGKPCPACEERTKIMSNPNLTEDQVKKAIEPFNTGRHPLGIYNIVHHLNPQFITWQEPVMYWPINNSFMESKLQSMSKAPMGGGYVNYMWPTAGEQGGRHISFEIVQKGQFFDYIGHAFYIRQNSIPEHILKQARCLDDMLDVGESWEDYYDELKDLIEAGMSTQPEIQTTGGYYTGPGIGYGSEPQQQPSLSSPETGLNVALPFSDCYPIGSAFESFNECSTCLVRVDCQAEAISSKEALPTTSHPTPIPVAAPSPTATGQTTPQAPIPRRAPK